LVAGYSADLRCESESRSFVKQRSGQKITLSGATYNIVAISQHDVTLEDSQTKKRTTIEWRGAP
jgi:Lhr-like helicase